ncbi:thioredoxin family protein [Patescibacteria group bacterium]|nr:thioredoxin family protein [Patescibacteria group bacterium]MBU1705350.1 thioredoxin family protein [Patescibacteria group bacterium]
MNVIVYSTPTCPYCVQLKEWLKKHQIDFRDFDVSADREKAEEMIKKSGQMGVPVIEIDDELIVGFDREQIAKVLNINE